MWSRRQLLEALSCAKRTQVYGLKIKAPPDGRQLRFIHTLVSCDAEVKRKQRDDAHVIAIRLGKTRKDIPHALRENQ
jgi:hypothetical protein